MQDPLEQNQINLEIRLSEDVPKEHDGFLAAILNEPWSWLIRVNEDVIRKRLQSGNIFLIGYGDKKADEQIQWIDLNNYNGKIPLILLETTAIKTDGNLDKIPKNYFDIENNGSWVQPVKDADTILMVDITAISSRRGKNGNGEVSQLISYAKELFQGQTEYIVPFDLKEIKHIWTYTPDYGPIMEVHRKNGAKDTGYKIKNARVSLSHVKIENGQRIAENFYHPLMHVNVMSYLG